MAFFSRAKYVASNLAKLVSRRNRGLLELPEADFKKLGKRVRKAGGKAVVLVHPFYSSPYTLEEKQYYDNMLKLLWQDKTPVIVLEAQYALQEVRRLLAGIAAPDHLLVPTQSASPSIVLHWEDWPKDHDHKQEGSVRVTTGLLVGAVAFAG